MPPREQGPLAAIRPGTSPGPLHPHLDAQLFCKVQWCFPLRVQSSTFQAFRGSVACGHLGPSHLSPHGQFERQQTLALKVLYVRTVHGHRGKRPLLLLNLTSPEVPVRLGGAGRRGTGFPPAPFRRETIGQNLVPLVRCSAYMARPGLESSPWPDLKPSISHLPCCL